MSKGNNRPHDDNQHGEQQPQQGEQQLVEQAIEYVVAPGCSFTTCRKGCREPGQSISVEMLIPRNADSEAQQKAIKEATRAFSEHVKNKLIITKAAYNEITRPPKKK